MEFFFQVCKQKVQVQPLQGNHRSILGGETVVKIADVLHKTLINA